MITKVNEIMRRLSNQIPAVMLREKTQLKAQEANQTRWSSTFHMLKRYLEIHQFLEEMDVANLAEHILSESQNAEVETLCKKLEEFDSVIIALQKESTTIADAPILFEAVI